MKEASFFVILIFACSGVFAVSGVSPASYDVDFEPGYNEMFVFNFVIEGKTPAMLYVEGDLAEYFSFDKNEILGMEKVSVNLNLPLETEKAGVSYVRIGARNSEVDIVGVIKVDIPYPENYVEVELSAPNVNSGEDVVFELDMIGKSGKSVVVSPRVEIYKDDKNIETVHIKDTKVFYGKKSEVNVSLNTDGYLAGDYLAIAFVDYDNISSSSENFFKVGEFSIGLINYTDIFRKNKINKFEFIIENFWGDDIEDVYVEVNFLDFLLADFTTSPERLIAWERQFFVGFLDASEVKEDNVEAEIILHYGNESVSQVVTLYFKEGIDYILLAIVTLSFCILVFLVWRSIVFIQRLKKHGNKYN